MFFITARVPSKYEMRSSRWAIWWSTGDNSDIGNELWNLGKLKRIVVVVELYVHKYARPTFCLLGFRAISSEIVASRWNLISDREIWNMTNLLMRCERDSLRNNLFGDKNKGAFGKLFRTHLFGALRSLSISKRSLKLRLNSIKNGSKSSSLCSDRRTSLQILVLFSS